jgi:hypothetical protein
MLRGVSCTQGQLKAVREVLSRKRTELLEEHMQEREPLMQRR